ncbi:hypothetical protein ANCCEY_08251 [Ancylostoma ceylanicum]|uniref:Uncharacterized protein n=1 Tax=Ancylostoma ceylanicum TaxID=53326 RepID=A0A0D6LYG3_9BILA|nr:hypothetical protein ANCCEY_08251 [Ancylostoma ceylanicum]
MASAMARRLKQERILKKERKLMEEEAEERRRESREKLKEEKGSKQDTEEGKRRSAESKSQEAAVDAKPGQRRKRKEKQDLQINERAALKEMSELYRDLLERFEELKQRQDSQLLAGSSMPQAQHHERELDHIVLELECAALIK